MDPDAVRLTPADAQEAWAARVRANRAQAERLREDAPSDDFYANVAPIFRADPTRRDDPSLNALLDLAHPDDTWLDVGAGGGRYGLGIARAVQHLIAVEPSAGMRAVFTETASDYGITNIDLRNHHWPADTPPPAVDIAFISHIGYDIEDIGPFLDALESAASRTCAALLMQPSPISGFASFWPAVHDEPQHGLPGLADFLALLLARGALPEMRLVDEHVWRFDSAADAEEAALRRLWLAPDGPKAARMRAALQAELLPDDRDPGAGAGPGVRLRHGSRIGLVTWTGSGTAPPAGAPA